MFSRNTKQKTMLLTALIGVLVISVGFAAMSTALKINSGANVATNSSDFVVKFSSSTTDVVEGDVEPSYLSHDTIVAENAIIENGDVGSTPMITNLHATLTEPGQSVSYTFYAHNIGKYDAYLTGIVFQSQANGNFITCDGGIESSEAMIEEACKSMSVTVRVESITDSSLVTESSSTFTGIESHLLSRDKYEKVIVTLKYGENGKRVDGDFEVHFGDIYLSYGTSELAEAPTIPDAEYACELSNDADSDEIADVGDVITCGTESFYVIPQDTTNHPADDTTISMLAMYNLDVGNYYDTSTSPDTNYVLTEDLTDTYGIQNEQAKALLPDSTIRYGVIPYSDTTYWLDGAGNLKEEYWYSDTEMYPAFVYDENSNIYPYIEAYETYLRKLGVNSAVATVLNPHVFTAEYDWLELTTYWTGVCNGNYTERISAGRTNVDPDAASQFASYNHSYANGIGIRPVVIIKKSELKPTTSSTICTAVTNASVGNVPEGNYTYGDEYSCEVKDDVWHTFFVLGENEEDSNKVDLILDSNINASGEPSEDNALVAWNENRDNASNGPITAMTFLSNATSTWDNLDSMTVSTYDDGNMTETFTTYAKLPKESQITGDETTAPWIYDVMSNDSEFWTSTSFSGAATCVVVPTSGYTDCAYNADEAYGIRPVITVSKSQMN